MSPAAADGLQTDSTAPRRNPMPTTTAQVQKIVNVVIPVADVDAAIDFYTGKLGLTKRTDIPFGG
jgi:hypothetical protein